MAERTTITLEDDVADRLRREMHASGRTLKEVVNQAIRQGLDARPVAAPFVVDARPMGLRPGLSYDDLERLLDVAEGPDRRW
jgi:hypothetical protein